MQKNNYEVLYNKYRPKNFDDLIGQNSTVKILKNQIKFDTVSHAYIFSGPRGTGKTSVARIFATAINCTSKEENKPCYNCRNCKEIELTSDIIELDAASNNRVGDIEEILKYVDYPPVSNRYKVFIIDEAHMLTTQAFNSLLKVMEEPPEYVVFILATTEINKIINTIRSRCISLDFRLIPNNLIVEKLKEILKKEKIKYQNEALEIIAEEANGSMRDALTLLENIIAFKVNDIRLKDEKILEKDVSEILGIISQEEIFNLIYLLNTLNLKEALDQLSKMFNKTNNIMSLYRSFVNSIIKLVYLKTSNINKLNVSEKQKTVIDSVNVNMLLNLLSRLGLIETRLLSSSQPYTVFEMTVLSSTMYSYVDSQNDDKIERIERLEKIVAEIKSNGVKINKEDKLDYDKIEEKKQEEKEVKILSRTKEGTTITPYTGIEEDDDIYKKDIDALFALNKVDRLYFISRSQGYGKNIYDYLQREITSSENYVSIRTHFQQIDKYSAFVLSNVLHLYILKKPAYDQLNKQIEKNKLLNLIKKKYSDINEIKFIDSDKEQNRKNAVGTLEKIIDKELIKTEKD